MNLITLYNTEKGAQRLIASPADIHLMREHKIFD